MFPARGRTAADCRSFVDRECVKTERAPLQAPINKPQPRKDLATSDSARAAASASIFDDCNVAAYRSKINSGSAVIHQKDDGRDVPNLFFH
jgi:hypothetical protein